MLKDNTAFTKKGKLTESVSLLGIDFSLANVDSVAVSFVLG